MSGEIRAQPATGPGTQVADAPWVDVMSADDERYGHQHVAPALVPSVPGPRWAERCFHSVHLAADLQLSAGRAVYRDGGRRTGYVAVSTGGATHAVRAQERFGIGDDADDPQVGPIRIEVVRPLREIRLLLDDPAVPLGIDLRFSARGPVVPTDRNVIAVRGEVVTDYMNFFQSGWYSGTIALDGVERVIAPVLGFRDRGWGTRKHEGAPRRGLVLFGAHEFPDVALWYLLYETASGRRVFTNGWLTGADGVRDTIIGIDHDLDLDAQRRCTGGRMRLACASGAAREFSFSVDARNYLAAGGYTAESGWPEIGYTRHDLDDAAVIARLNGQNDNGGPCRLDGVDGHGFLETGIGVHPRYRPNDDTAGGE